MKHYKINNVTYTRSELSQKIKKIKRCYAVGEELIPKHQAFLKQLLCDADPDRQHHWLHSETKLSVVVSGVSATGYTYTKFSGKKGEQIMPISINKALDNLYLSKDELHKKDVKSAARRAIAEQIKKYRDKLDDEIQTCAITGEAIDLTQDRYNIDHTKPFWVLLQDWMASRRITYADIQIEDGQFAVSEAAEDWREYHACHAEFQITTPEANKRKGGSIR